MWGGLLTAPPVGLRELEGDLIESLVVPREADRLEARQGRNQPPITPQRRAIAKKPAAASDAAVLT